MSGGACASGEAFHRELWDARTRSRRRVARVTRRLERAAERRRLTEADRIRLQAYRQVLAELDQR